MVMLGKVMMIAAVALALAPGVGRAAWQAPVIVAGPTDNGGYPPQIAVADDGRAVTSAWRILSSAISVTVPGGAVTSIVVPDLQQQPGGIAFAPDGAIVAAGTVSSNERPPDPEGKSPACCARPAVVRWRPGLAPTAPAIVQPPNHANYAVQAFALDDAGAAIVVAEDPDDRASVTGEPSRPTLVAIRMPADGAPPALTTLRYRRRSIEAPFPFALRAWPDRAGATLAFNAGRRWGRLAVERGGWRAGAGVPLGLGDLEPLALGLGPRGDRVVVTGDRERHLELHVAGRRTQALGRGDLESLAVGDDGTVAILTADRDRRLSLRSVDPHGRVGARRRLGTLRAESDFYPTGSPEGPFLAVDAQGHAHVAWNPPGTGAIVVGPHGRRHLPGAVRAMAVSPRGVTAVALRYDGALHVAVDTRRR
jgi:hypothetical protein